MLFSERSYEKELLDGDKIAAPDLYLNLKELHVINKYLGGYKASSGAIQDLIKKKKEIRNVLDVGFGGGDFIRELNTSTNNKLHFYGVDLKKECVYYANENLKEINNKTLICDDYKNIGSDLLNEIDVIHCSLFLHHLTEDQIIDFFYHARKHNCTVLVNDLHRHWFAYYSIKLLTYAFSNSKLVKNDAPLSVKRAFSREELISMAKMGGYTEVSVNWNWAFRYTLTAVA
jgi:2-polyprenyl-3-methyl-5-hydroxy-6-metoxy-1,4-benzoquinol methylase